MAKTSPLEFFQQVKQEASKVTWTPRNELLVTTVMVFIFVALAAVFFLLVDQILGLIVRQLLGLGG